MDFKISETYVKVFVIAFSLVGVGILLVISTLSEIEEVPISELGDHIGEEVSCRGSVVGAVHYEMGSARILIADGLDLLEIYVERSSRKVKPGDMIRTTGEPFGSGGEVTMTVDSDKCLELMDFKEPLEIEDGLPGSICSLTGTISTCRTTYDEGFSASVYRRCGEDIMLYEVISSESTVTPFAGSMVNITGLLSGNNSLISFGESVQVISEPRSTDSSLGMLVEEMRSSPGRAPLYPMDITAYVSYEPMGTTLYVSEEPQGGKISIRVNILKPNDLIHKGDLIELVNSTLLWDPEKARYELQTDTVRVIEAHGPWVLNLESLEWGVSEFEGCQVILEGLIEIENGSTVISDGMFSIELMGGDELQVGEIDTLQGEIAFLPRRNIYVLDLGAVD